MNSFSDERANEGSLTALYKPMTRTLADGQNSIKNLSRGLLVPPEVVEFAGLMPAGSSLTGLAI
jgi:hypothetical protein